MKYLMKFSKDGYIVYTSHLDIMRLFKRSFKRTGIMLQYSEGFNPHPKMSFAQPLSLGYSSGGEYLEFETKTDIPAVEINEKMKAIMPRGVDILDCKRLPISGKTIAAAVTAADYELTIPFLCEGEAALQEIIGDFMKQDQVFVKKMQKKTGREIETDIRPMIISLTGNASDDNCILLTAKLHAGSISNLSVEHLLVSFCAFASIKFERPEVKIKRIELYGRVNGQDLALSDYFA